MRYSFLNKNPELEEKKFQEQVIQKKIERKQFYYQKKENIIYERRKRNQTYLAMNYLIRKTTLFDYCSNDVLDILYSAQVMALIWKTPFVLTSHLLFSFLKKEGELKQIFLNSGINNEDLFYFLFQLQFTNNSIVKTPFERIKKLIKEKWTIFEPSFLLIFDPEKALVESEDRKTLLKRRLELIDFHSNCYEIFDLALENTLERFKLCSLTPETLLFTILENENCTASLILKRFFDTELDWLVFRFKYLKLVYRREISIRNSITSSEYYLLTVFHSEFTNRSLNILRKEPKRLSQLLLQIRKNLLVSSLDSKALIDLISKDILSETYFNSLILKEQIDRKSYFKSLFDQTQTYFLHNFLFSEKKENTINRSSDLVESVNSDTYPQPQDELKPVVTKFVTSNSKITSEMKSFSSHWHYINAEIEKLKILN